MFYKTLYKKIIKHPFSLIAVMAMGIIGMGLGYTTLYVPEIVEASPNDNAFGYAWNENTGWISLNCIDEGTCGSSNYGVTISENASGGAHPFSGYGWSSNLGWVNFGGNNCGGGAYLDVDDVDQYANGNTNTIPVYGMIEVLSASNASADQSGDWSGCVNMRNDTIGYGVELVYNNSQDRFDFDGKAWNADTQVDGDTVGMGWIYFDNAFTTIDFQSNAYCDLVPQFPNQSCGEDVFFNWDCSGVVQDSCEILFSHNGAVPAAFISGLPETNQGYADVVSYTLTNPSLDSSFYVSCDPLVGNDPVESNVFTTSCLGAPECSDGKDNDADGHIDNGPGSSTADDSCYSTCDANDPNGVYLPLRDNEQFQCPIGCEDPTDPACYCQAPYNTGEECFECDPLTEDCVVNPGSIVGVPDIIES